MAIKPLRFQFQSKTGETLSFTSEVTLTTEGIFNLTIPDELEKVARNLTRSSPAYAGLALTRPRAQLRVSGPVLAGCKDFIEAAAHEYLQCEESTELVIVYSTENKVAYFKTPEGNLYPNAASSEDAHKAYTDNTGKWGGTLTATNGSPHYQVGIFARVVRKRTFTRASGSMVRYEPLSSHEMPQESWMVRLNSFVGLKQAYSHQDGYTDMARLAQMPYTEEAARFFFESLLAMCRLSDRLDSFFKDPATLRLAIAQNAGLLQGPQS